MHFFDISISKSCPSMVCFLHFGVQMCFAPQRRAIFHLEGSAPTALASVPFGPLYFFARLHFFLICFFSVFLLFLFCDFSRKAENRWQIPNKNENQKEIGENHENVDETHEEIDGNHRQTDEIHGKIDAKHDKIDEQCWNMKTMGNRCTTWKIDENRWQIDKNHRENDAHLGKTMEIIEKSKAKTKTKGQNHKSKTKKYIPFKFPYCSVELRHGEHWFV